MLQSFITLLAAMPKLTYNWNSVLQILFQKQFCLELKRKRKGNEKPSVAKKSPFQTNVEDGIKDLPKRKSRAGGLDI